MLELRPNCEHCGKSLPPGSKNARICSFEVTYCATCADGALKGKCPSCGGELAARPVRSKALAARYPAKKKSAAKPREAAA
ncbi:MAG TPA: DUF1272 domain-containing protein [Rhizomicrobium sp.]